MPNRAQLAAVGAFCLCVTGAITYRVFGGEAQALLNTPGYGHVLVVNLLIGVSIALFVLELRGATWALLGTVIAALLFGYALTIVLGIGDGTLSAAIAQATDAYRALLFAPTERPNRWAIWVQDATTLTLLGLAFVLVFQARQFSLGAEGQLYFGALAAGGLLLGMGSYIAGWILLPLAVLVASLSGFLWGLLPGTLKGYLGANEIVSTLMLNVVAARFYEMVLTFRLRPESASIIASAYFPAQATLSPLLQSGGANVGVYMAVAAVAVAWLLVRRSVFGYELRMVGANADFATQAGIPTRRTIALVMAVSGVFAGLAGLHLAAGVHRRLVLNLSPGLAFEGVVVALLARNNVLVVPFAALLYAYLRSGAQFMERDTNISFEIVGVVQALLILLISARVLAKQRRQPT